MWIPEGPDDVELRSWRDWNLRPAVSKLPEIKHLTTLENGIIKKAAAKSHQYFNVSSELASSVEG